MLKPDSLWRNDARTPHRGDDCAFQKELSLLLGSTNPLIGVIIYFITQWVHNGCWFIIMIFITRCPFQLLTKLVCGVASLQNCTVHVLECRMNDTLINKCTEISSSEVETVERK